MRAAWDDALRASVAVLASTAFDRAVSGTEQRVYHKGVHVGTNIKYDNKLLMFLLRVRDPLNYAPLDDLQGWLRHRDVEAPLTLYAPVERLIAAEQDWGRRVDPRSSGAATLRQSQGAAKACLPGSSATACSKPGKDAS